jgi:Zn-dependent protease
MSQGAMNPVVTTATEISDPEEALYQQAQYELRNPPPAKMTGLVFVLLFLVFLAGQFEYLKSPLGIAVLVGVIAFHEAGHAFGMRLFGFRDVRMFFIPFFGAAVSGRPRGVAAWKEGVVSLLGPIPGIVAGLSVLYLMRAHPTTLSVTAIQSLLFLNVFNLLPLGFLDGGRFIERVIFSRHRVLHVGFLGLGSLALGYLAVKAEMYVVALFVGLSILGLPRRYKVLKAATRLRRAHPTFIPDPEALGEVEGRAIFGAARAIVPGAAGDQPRAISSTMESIVDAMKRAPGVLASMGLLAVYGVASVLGVIGILWVSMETRSASWRIVEHEGWRVDFPQAPQQTAERDGGLRWRVGIDGIERFNVCVTEAQALSEPGDAWMDQAARRLGMDTKTNVIRTGPITVAGVPGRDVDLSAPGRSVRARFFSVGSRRYEVSTSAPAPSANQRRFIESFTIVGPPSSGTVR